MKELSIEEKARRYDEAIEIAKEINNKQQAQPFNVMTRVFPELAESEDERIRKAIIDVLKAVYECADIPFISQKQTLDSYVAWLEKQGEQKPIPDWMPKFLDELRSKKNYFDWDEHRNFEGRIRTTLMEKMANAPEKLYIALNELTEDGRTFVLDHLVDYPICTEYIRTDAFINAVCDWLYDNLQTVVDVNCPSAHHVESVVVLGNITQSEFVENFKKEIKYLID